MSSVHEFNPGPNESLTIGGHRYIVKPHPAVPSFAFGQEGRKAFVFQVSGPDGNLYALKKFKEAYRVPELKEVCDALAQFANMPGLEVCARECLVRGRHEDTLSMYPDLEYAVLMPWISGLTWYDVIISQRPLRREHTVIFAHSLAQVLRGLEEVGLAHCDIAGPNVIINDSLGSAHLIDVEDLYAPDFNPPGALPAGTDGYAHSTAFKGLWKPAADRFAGAVLIAEILAWHDPEIRKKADEEHYFAGNEMQQDTERYQLMHDVLGMFSPEMAGLFEQVWFSETLEDCPPLWEWHDEINKIFQDEQRSKVISGWIPLTGDLGRQPDAPRSAEVEDVRIDETVIEQSGKAAKEKPEQPAPAAKREPAAPNTHPQSQSRPIAIPPTAAPGAGGPVAEWRSITMTPQATSQGNGTISVSRPIYTPPPADTLVAETVTAERPENVPAEEPGAVTQTHEVPDQVVAEERVPSEVESPDPIELAAGLLKPVLDLQRIDNNKPHLVWSESPEATQYVLQEDDQSAFEHPKEYKIKGSDETRWSPPFLWRRTGKLYFRVRAMNREGVGPWSNTLSLRIGSSK